MPRLAQPPIPKLTRPRLHGILPRERLFDLLAAASPVAWIAALPGSGKTTLASSYSDRSGARTLWYQLDSGDADPATFFHYLRGLASALSSSKSARLPVLPSEGGVDLAVFARRFFRLFFALLPARAIWVIDNFQEADCPALGDILREAFDQAPSSLSVIVLSLVDPPPALARLVGNGSIRTIRPADLRFTRQESDALVLAKIAVDQGVLAGMHDLSSGWAAGLVLMIEHMRRAGGQELASLDESQAAAFDYFAAEILADCSDDERRTLMLTASLPRVTARLAEAISGRSGDGALLERLHRRHLFVDRRGATEPSYFYHGLFKSFLAARARQVLSARERAEAAERAAAALEASGEAEDAITMHLAAPNWAAAARLLTEHARRLHDQGRWRTLLDWISALPPELLADTPWLLYWAGACQLWSDPPVGRRMLERAFRRFQEIDDAAGQVSAAGAMTRACILDADWSQLDRWIDELAARLSDAASIAEDVLLAGLARLLYVAFARQPTHPQLSRWADRARSLLASTADPTEAVFAGYSLVFFFTWTGQHAESEEIICRIAPLTEHARLSPVARVHWIFAYAAQVLRFGDPRKALALMERAFETASSHGLAIAAVIRRHRIAHLLTNGLLDEAESELDKLAAAPRVEPYFELRAWLAWQRGDTTIALDEAARALQLATERGRTFYFIQDWMLLACISAAAGQCGRALDHLRSYEQATKGMPGELATFQARLTEAFIALSQGRRNDALAPLQQALEIGRRQHYRACWPWSPSMIVPLLALALEHDVCAPYCRELIRLHRLAPPSPDAKRWPWPVRIRTLGRFEVELDGVVLRFAGKTQRKPLEMLKIMVASGDRTHSIESLIDLLWPGPDDGGRKAFDINVHRLRKLLACDFAVAVADRHASLDGRYVWVDAWEIERTLEQLVPVAGSAATGARLEAAAPAVFALFEGPFLPAEGGESWQLAARQRLTARLHRYAERLGEHWEAAERWAQAGQLYQRMVEIDPLAESFYRRHMLCLRAQGRRAEAIEVFRRCRHSLATTLGVAPGPEVEQVYRELVTS